MKDLIFHEGELPSGCTFAFESSIFNRPAHLKLQSEKGWLSFYIVNKNYSLAYAQVHFFIEGDVASSPLRSPFGGFEFSKKLTDSTVFNFIVDVEQRLKDLNVRRVIIKNFPEAYNHDAAQIVTTFLLNLNYQIITAEVSSVIPVSHILFQEKIHVRKKRKLRQSRTETFVFKILPIENLEGLYEFIRQCRDEKDFKLSISSTDLRKTVERFPNEFLLFGLYHADRLVGGSVAIRVNKGILYHFISDYVRTVNHARTGLVLMDNIYSFCQDNEIALLDLGTSALDGRPNFKLLNYKSELGGIPTSKFTFAKDLA